MRHVSLKMAIRLLYAWGAYLLRLLKDMMVANRHALVAGSGGAEVTDALPDGIDNVGWRPGRVDGEEGRGRGDVAW